MKLVHKYKFLGSSQNPEKIGLTVKGIGMGLIPLFILIGRTFGLELVEADLVQVINAISGISSFVMVIVGITRKYYKK